MTAIRRGLGTGLFAGLVLAMLDFVVNGAPGNGLPEVLRWFDISISNVGISRPGGFALLIVLGGIFGLIFGAITHTMKHHTIQSSKALLLGLGLGFAWWLILSEVLCNIAYKNTPLSLNLTGILSTLPLDLVFGIVLGTAYYRLQERSASNQPDTE